MKLGIKPKEIFTNNTFAQILGNQIRETDFITITVPKGPYVSETTSIIGLISDDSLSMSFGSKYTRPFENVIGKVTEAAAGGIGQAASGVMNATGTPLYNRYATVPIWQMPELSEKTIKFTLIATGDPAEEVEMPLVLLSRMVLPKSSGGTVESVITPGAKLTLNIDNFKAAASNNIDGKLIDTKGSVAIQYGGLAYFQNCIISRVSYTVQNIQTMDEDGVPYYKQAEVEIVVLPFFPPEYMGTTGTNLGDIKLFSKVDTNEYADFL